MTQDPAVLEPVTAVLQLVQGVDTKTDDEVSATDLARLENASFFHPGAIAKDDGYIVLSTSGITSPLRRLIEHGETQVLHGSDRLYERSDGADMWRALNTTPAALGCAAAERVDDLSTSLEGVQNCDYAYANGYESIITQSPNITLQGAIRDAATGAILHQWAVGNSPPGPLALTEARTVACGNGVIVLVWISGADVYVSAWNSLTPTVAPIAPTIVASDANAANKRLDVAASQTSTSQFAIAYTSTVPNVTIRRCSTTPASLGTVTVAENANQWIAIAGDSSGNYLCAYANTANGTKMFGSTGASGATGNSTVDAAATTGARGAVVANENATGRGTVLYERAGAVDVKSSQVAFTGAGGALSTATLFGVRMAHRPVRIGPAIYFGVTYFDTLAGTGIDTVHQRVAVTIADSALDGANGAFEPVCYYLYGTMQDPTTWASVNIAPVTVTDSVGGFVEYRWAAVVSEVFGGDAVLNDNVVICAFRPFDGQSVPWRAGALVANQIITSTRGPLESTFGWAPVIRASAQSATGSLVVGETYQWQAVYEMTCPDGTIVRSVPSNVVTETITGGNGRVTFTVDNPLCHASAVTRIRLFRSQAGPGATKTVTSAVSTSSLVNAATSSMIDGDSDASIAPNRLIYTTGGVLEAFPQPMSSALALHQNRLFTIEALTREIRYTRQLVSGEGPGWHPILAFDCSGQNLDPRALISTSNGLWVLGRDRQTGAGAIALLVGTGPDDTGVGSTYDLQRLETADVGPQSWRQVVSTPAGVFFEDPIQGFHLLPPGGAPVFAGAPVEDLRGLPAVSQQSSALALHVLQDRKEVRCLLDTDSQGNRLLVYHYDVGQWSERTINPTAGTPVDATVWRNEHVCLMSDVLVRQGLRRTSTTFRDNSVFYALRLKTNWIRMSDFAGLQKVWEIWLCGTYVSAHSVTVNLYYDGGTTPDVYTFSAADTAANAADYRLRIRPRRRKMERLMVEILDSDAGSGTREGARWNAIRINYGALRTGRRGRTTGLKG